MSLIAWRWEQTWRPEWDQDHCQPDGTLTREATRQLLDAWDRQDDYTVPPAPAEQTRRRYLGGIPL